MIDVYLAEIDCSVVAATVTCRKQNMCWTFGPGDRGSVKNCTTGQTLDLRLEEDMWPVSIEHFTRVQPSSKDKPKYNSSDVYTKKLSKPKYNSFEVYTKKIGLTKPVLEHVSKSPSTTSQPISTPTTTEPERPSTILKPDIPIGRKAPKHEKSCLWHARTGHQGSEKLQFCSRCTIYRDRGLKIDPGDIDLEFVCESCREASAHK